MTNEPLVGEVTKVKEKFSRYYIQFYDKKRGNWYNIHNKVELTNFEKAYYKEFDVCLSKYGIDGILDKKIAIKYLKKLREVLSENRDMLTVAPVIINRNDIEDFRLCKSTHVLSCKVLNIE